MQSDIKSYQTIMKYAFEKQLLKRVSSLKNIYYDMDDKVGLENEYFIVDKNLKPIDQSIRDEFVSKVPMTKCELGASQIEFNSIPTSIKYGYSNLLCHVKKYEAYISTVADQYGCYILRMGTYPGKLEDIRVTYYPEVYQNVLEQYKDNRKGYIDNNIGYINLGDRIHELIAGCQSSQLNIQVDYYKSIQLLNKVMELSPLFIALSANSPILDKNISGYLETRNIIWENGYDLRTYIEYINNVSFRTNFPYDYYQTLEEYWTDMKNQTFMKYEPECAFQNNQKMYWKIARIKLVGSKCLLEIRFMPIQPTAEEDIALYLSIYALLMNSLSENQDLIPITFVKENFRRTTKWGLDTQIFTYKGKSNTIIEKNVQEVIEEALRKITDFWNNKSLETSTFIQEIINNKLKNGPSALEQIKLLKQGTIDDVIRKYIVKVNCRYDEYC
jgi:Uncharacterized conserved protein